MTTINNGGKTMNAKQVLVLANMKENEQEKLVNSFSTLSFTFKDAKTARQQDVDKADIIIGNPSTSLSLYRENLQLLQLNSAGSDYYIQEGILHPNTKLANASGSYGKAIAEHTIGMMLALNKNFKTYFKNMESGLWQGEKEGKEIYGSHVVIVGLGDLGYQLATRLKGFGCHITGIKRTMTALPKDIDALYTMEALDDVLPSADFVILCLPQTKQTIHIMNKTRLLSMKKDAMLINVGRGSAIDSSALVDVLDSGHLYGVALDVCHQEPLEPSHKLWGYKNVFITPHVSGGFTWPSVRLYFMELAIRNLHHFLRQEELENSVDFTTGYRKINTAL